MKICCQSVETGKNCNRLHLLQHQYPEINHSLNLVLGRRNQTEKADFPDLIRKNFFLALFLAFVL